MKAKKLVTEKADIHCITNMVDSRIIEYKRA